MYGQVRSILQVIADFPIALDDSGASSLSQGDCDGDEISGVKVPAVVEPAPLLPGTVVAAREYYISQAVFHFSHVPKCY